MAKNRCLIREFIELCPGGVCEDLLTESEKQMRRNGQMILSGKIQEAEIRNGNGRIYPKRVLEREIENYQQTIKRGSAVGSIDHPDSSIVGLRDASHMFLRMWWNGNEVYGTCKVLTTPDGKILEALVNDGVKLGISSRALGSVSETREGTIVEDDLQLLAFDFVQEPSSPQAFMSLKEAKNYDTSKVFTKEDRIYRALNDIIYNKRNNG